MTRIDSYNPTDNTIIGSLEAHTPEEIRDIVATARGAYSLWSHTPIRDRVEIWRRVYEAFETRREEIAMSIAREMGMPIRLARDEVGYGLAYFLWYLDNAEKYLSPEVTHETDTEIHTVYCEPRGVIAAITPWNYPFMLFVWACIQPLLAGNTVIWKISKETILTGKLISEIISSMHIPVGVWTEVYGDGHIGEILTDQDIDGITFTGSTRVGEMLGKKASEKGIPIVMELGGSAPGIVCADADIDSILETIYFMRFSNSGQMCDGLKRLIVHASRYDELVEKLSKILLSKKVGNALDESTDIGPLVSLSQKSHALEQLQDARDKGCSILCENTPESILRGSYIGAYILSDITTDMCVWREEVFAPILPIVTFDTLDEAISMANDTIYGLGAYVFTRDREVFHQIARGINSGMVQLNNVNYCIPQDPFGGYKSSGIGREHGKWGYHEFTRVKVLSEPK